MFDCSHGGGGARTSAHVPWLRGGGAVPHGRGWHGYADRAAEGRRAVCCYSNRVRQRRQRRQRRRRIRQPAECAGGRHRAAAARALREVRHHWDGGRGPAHGLPAARMHSRLQGCATPRPLLLCIRRTKKLQAVRGQLRTTQSEQTRQQRSSSTAYTATSSPSTTSSGTSTPPSATVFAPLVWTGAAFGPRKGDAASILCTV